MLVKLNTTTAAVFDLVNTKDLYPQVAFGAWGEVDFEALNIEQAEALLAKGFPYLKRKETPKQKPAEPKD